MTLKINDGAVFVDLDDTLVRSSEINQPSAGFILGFIPKKSKRKEGFTQVEAWSDLVKDYSKLKLEELASIALARGAVAYEYEGKIRLARLRPGAREFLKEIKKHVNNVFILTTGGVDHQSLVANTLSILPTVDGLFNLGSSVPQFRWPVLVDDLGPTTSGVMAKLEKIGMISPEDWQQRDVKMEKKASKFFCHIDPWREENFNDNVFETVTSNILHKLSGLIRNKYWEDGVIFIPE